MKRTMCCPKCKNTDLTVPDNLKEKVVCGKCEYSFFSLDALKRKKVVLNRIFLVSMILFVITLLAGTFLFFLPVYGEYNIPVQKLLAKLLDMGLSEDSIVVNGIILYIISLITMICVFTSAYYSHHYREKRWYLRKYGFIYEKREKSGSNRY